jgi:hypothetical protein
MDGWRNDCWFLLVGVVAMNDNGMKRLYNLSFALSCYLLIDRGVVRWTIYVCEPHKII